MASNLNSYSLGGNNTQWIKFDFKLRTDSQSIEEDWELLYQRPEEKAGLTDDQMMAVLTKYPGGFANLLQRKHPLSDVLKMFFLESAPRSAFVVFIEQYGLDPYLEQAFLADSEAEKFHRVGEVGLVERHINNNSTQWASSQARPAMTFAQNAAANSTNPAVLSAILRNLESNGCPKDAAGHDEFCECGLNGDHFALINSLANNPAVPADGLASLEAFLRTQLYTQKDRLVLIGNSHFPIGALLEIPEDKVAPEALPYYESVGNVHAAACTAFHRREDEVQEYVAQHHPHLVGFPTEWIWNALKAQGETPHEVYA